MPAKSDPPPPPPREPATPADVPDARSAEQIRQMAELLADLHRMLGIIDHARAELLPGELQTRFHNAWVEASEGLRTMTRAVIKDSNDVKNSESSRNAISVEESYKSHGLFGAVGRLKRTICRASIDEFHRWFNPEPRTAEAVHNALLVGARTFDAFSVLVDSIPDGAKQVVEFCSFTKHVLELGAQRWADRGSSKEPPR